MQSTSSKMTVTNIYVGEKLQQRRKELGLTQKDVSAQLGIPFEKIRQYEQGTSHMGTDIYRLADILEVAPLYFFAGIANEKNDLLPQLSTLDDEDTLSFMRSYRKIGSDHSKRNLFKLIQSVVKDEFENRLTLIANAH